MKTLISLFLLLLAFFANSCVSKMENNMKDDIKNELSVIDSFLRDADYNVEMARVLEAVYYQNTGQSEPAFLPPAEDTSTIRKNVKEEKIAINVAGFYALECGLGILCSQTNETPVEWLKKITGDTADSTTVSLLNRFANATWKAGQPFRGMKRIIRPAFTVFNFLPPGEVKKDHDQIKTAADKLLTSMQDVTDSSAKLQMQKIRSLMQNKDFTLEMATAMHAVYYSSQQQSPPDFLTQQDDTATIIKLAAEQRIATNVAGFYALECGLNYFAATENMLPSVLLRSIVNDSINKNGKMLFLRFANATWKAGQPFRDLNRIERDNFIPFNLLDETEVEKDWVQIKAAAEKLLNDMK